MRGHNGHAEKGKSDDAPPQCIQASSLMADMAQSVTGAMKELTANQKSDILEMSQSQAHFGGRAEQEHIRRNKGGRHE